MPIGIFFSHVNQTLGDDSSQQLGLRSKVESPTVAMFQGKSANTARFMCVSNKR